jgi:hypothetical protein
MDPVTLVLTALAAGSAAGISATASTAIQDAYQGLCSAARRLVRGSSEPNALDEYVADPISHHDSLAEVLAAGNAAQDRVLVEAALRMLALTHPGSQESSAKYSVHAEGAKGLVVGDHAQQTNTFN